MRLIDADALLREIQSYVYDTENIEKRRMEHTVKAHICEIIDKQPKIDIDKNLDELEDYLFEKYCVEGDSKVDEIMKAEKK